MAKSNFSFHVQLTGIRKSPIAAIVNLYLQSSIIGLAIYKFISNVMAINYYINGVWKNSSKVITHVSLCANNAGNFSGGIKTAEADVVRLIEARNIVYTLVWIYPGWTTGANVEVVHSNGSKFLRTVSNATTKDNLDNSLDMSGFKSI